MILRKYDKIILNDGTEGIVVFSYENHIEILKKLTDEEIHYVDIKEVKKVIKHKKINGYDDRFIDYEYKFALLYSKCLDKYNLNVPDIPAILRKNSNK